MSLIQYDNGLVVAAGGAALIYDAEAMGGNRPGSLTPNREFTAVMPDEVLKTTPWANWGDNNRFPEEAVNYIKTTHILNSIIEGKARFSLNKGMVPVLGTRNADGDVQVEQILEDAEITTWMDENRMFLQCYGWMKDYAAFRNAAGRIMLSADRQKIARIQRDDVTTMRKERMDTMGRINHIYFSREWGKVATVADNRIRKIKHLELDNALAELNQYYEKTNVVEFAFTFKDPDWCTNYYSSPMWWAALEWVKIAQGVPKMKAAMYENVFRPKCIVYIQKEFWSEYLFRDKDGNPLPGNAGDERRNLKKKFYDDIAAYATGQSNSYKAIFSEKYVDPGSGKEVKYIEIQTLEDKSIDGELLKDSSTANSELAFAMQFNPSILGANLPSGPYTNSQGGSNAREAHIQQVLQHETERQHLRDIMMLVAYYNGWKKKYPKLEFIIPATVPTTLDTGGNTRNVGSTPAENNTTKPQPLN